MINFGSNLLNIGMLMLTKNQPLADHTINIIYDIIVYVFAIVGALASIWAIWCAICMMKANDKEKRDAAKKRLIYTVAGAVVTLMLCAILYFVKDNIVTWFGDGFTLNQ